MSGSLLYLDFDGVLHHHNVMFHPLIGPYLSAAPEGAVLFQHMNVLQDLLKPYPAVQIVLSTSWVARLGLAMAKKQLHPDLRQRVIGATCRSSKDRARMSNLSRGQQVLADVHQRQPTAWLAVDDDASDWPMAYRARLVHTDKYLGLGDMQAVAALQSALIATFGAQR